MNPCFSTEYITKIACILITFSITFQLLFNQAKSLKRCLKIMLSLPTSLTWASVCAIIRNLVHMTMNWELYIAYNSTADIQI